MSDASVDQLIGKLEMILHHRQTGSREQARLLFNEISAADFPVMARIPMSHGPNCDAVGALFYIDHDWDDHGGDDPNWCNLFIIDVINGLQSTKSTGVRK